jgi:hypothetical protein
MNNTPMEAWIGKNPSLQHLCIFGFEAYTHVPKEKRSKFDNKVLKCIFINYGVGVKGYKLWDIVAFKVLYNINLIFTEVKSSSIVMQPEEHGKKLVVYPPPETQKYKPKNEQ